MIIKLFLASLLLTSTTSYATSCHTSTTTICNEKPELSGLQNLTVNLSVESLNSFFDGTGKFEPFSRVNGIIAYSGNIDSRIPVPAPPKYDPPTVTPEILAQKKKIEDALAILASTNLGAEICTNLHVGGKCTQSELAKQNININFIKMEDDNTLAHESEQSNTETISINDNLLTSSPLTISALLVHELGHARDRTLFKNSTTKEFIYISEAKIHMENVQYYEELKAGGHAFPSSSDNKVDRYYWAMRKIEAARWRANNENSAMPNIDSFGSDLGQYGLADVYNEYSDQRLLHGIGGRTMWILGEMIAGKEFFYQSQDQALPNLSKKDIAIVKDSIYQRSVYLTNMLYGKNKELMNSPGFNPSGLDTATRRLNLYLGLEWACRAAPNVQENIARQIHAFGIAMRPDEVTTLRKDLEPHRCASKLLVLIQQWPQTFNRVNVSWLNKVLSNNFVEPDNPENTGGSGNGGEPPEDTPGAYPSPGYNPHFQPGI